MHTCCPYAEDTALRAVIFMTIFSSSVLLDTTFSRLVFFVTVMCHCSSMTKCHVNLFVYNNNNNNKHDDDDSSSYHFRDIQR